MLGPLLQLPRRHLALFVLSMIGITTPASAFTPASASTASAAALDRLTVVVDGYELFVHVDPASGSNPYTALDAVVVGANGNVRAASEAVTEDDGSARFAFVSTGVSSPRRPILVRAGDQLIVRAAPDARAPAGTPPIFLGQARAPTFTALADGPAGVVAGLATPGSRITVLLQPPDGGASTPPAHAEADANGAWRAPVIPGQALAPGSRGVAYYADGKVTVQHAWVVPQFEVKLGSSEVRGTVLPGESVSVRLEGSAGAAGAGGQLATGSAAAWDGTVSLMLRDGDGREVLATPGGRLSLDSTLTLHREVTLPPLDLRVDDLAERISGQTAPGHAVRLRISDAARPWVPAGCPAWPGVPIPQPAPADPAPLERLVAADAAGYFTLDLAGAYDVTKGTRVVASWPDVAEVALVAYVPAITAIDPMQARVWGQGAAESPATATLVAADGTVRATAAGRVDGDGRIALELADAGPSSTSDRLLGATSAGHVAPAVLQDGDAIRLETGGGRFEAAASPLHVAAPASRDRVTGRAVPGAVVGVEVGGAVASPTAGADGSWIADFAGRADLQPGMNVAVRAADDHGVCRPLDFLVARVTVQVDTDRVRIEGPPGMTTTVAARLGLREHGSGGCTIIRDACDARVTDPEGRPAHLGEGDLVEAAMSDGELIPVEVGRLVAHVDPTGNGVTGGGPPGLPVRLEMSSESSAGVPLGSVSSINELGDYDFMFSSADVPFTLPGLVGDVFAIWPSGHQLWARGVVEQISVTLNRTAVRGLAEPGSRVDAMVLPPDRLPIDGVDPSGTTTADADGRFFVSLTTADGAPPPLAVGQRLLVAHSRRVHEFTLPTVAAWATDRAGSIAGVTLPGLAVKIVLALPTQRLVYPALVDPSGTFVFDPPPVDARLILTREVVATLPRGEEVGVVVAEGEVGGRVYLPAADR